MATKHNLSSDLDEDSLSDENDFESQMIVAPGADQLKGGIWPMNLGKSYVQGWSEQDAIREFLQNQKDGIMTTFHLGPREYHARLEVENKKEIVVTIRHPRVREKDSTQMLLGYIRYDKKASNIEFSNFRAKLTAANLELGGTTKRGQKDAVGKHGEGFKVAALILSRYGYRVRYSASSFYWNFGFKNKSDMTGFHCRLTSPTGGKLAQQRTNARALRKSPRGFISHIWEDVSVTIGRVMGKGLGISEVEFLLWLKVSFDVEGHGRPANADMIQTKHGDLIFDKAFSGAIYLKSLRLCNSSASGTPTQYGYNFLDGQVNRDRQRLSNASDEAILFADIWQHAIELKGDFALKKYVNLLRDHPRSPEVHNVEKNVKQDIAKLIWSTLQDQAPDRFYFSEKSGAEDVDLIRRQLEKNPERLPEALWSLLRKFELIKTPQEYIDEQFENSESSSVPETPFAVNVKRCLRAAMELDLNTRYLTMQFVHTDIDSEDSTQLLFSPSSELLKIHERWLHMEKIHESSSCDLQLLSNSMTGDAHEFTCQHVVEDLYNLVLNEILCRLDFTPNHITQIQKSLLPEVRIKLRQMPSILRVMPTDTVGQLRVVWMNNESKMISKFYGSRMKYVVVLHREKHCSEKREILLFHADFSHDTNIGQQHSASCGCPQKIVSQQDERTIFSGLDPQEWYFPMVARHGLATFYGVSPPPERPRARAAASLVSPWMMPSTSALAQGTQQTTNSQSDAIELFDLEIFDEGDDITAVKKQKEEPGAPHLYSATLASRVCTSGGTRGEPAVQQDYNARESIMEQRKQDEAWKEWEQRELQSIFDGFSPIRILREPEQVYGGRHYFSDQLKLDFMAGEYYQLSPQPSRPIRNEQIIFVHGFDKSTQNRGSVQLIVTRYSMPSDWPLFSSIGDTSGELILHFTSYNDMGTERDAEVIELNDLIRDSDHNCVEHLSDFPLVYLPTKFMQNVDSKLEDEDFRCCFAVRSRDEFNTASITSVAPHLLQPKWRKKSPGYPPSSRPIVYDATTNVLGASEGFSQAQFDIFAGFNFEKDRSMTWKTRHDKANTYDTSLESTFGDFENGKLIAPKDATDDVPKVLLVTGPNERFHLRENTSLKQENSEEFSRNPFLAPLKNITESVLKVLGANTFVVATMPSSILHADVSTEFTKAMATILTAGLSLYLRKIYLPDHGIPQDRTVIALIGSPQFVSSPWVIQRVPTKVRIRDCIDDLTFANERRNIGDQISSICAIPDGSKNTYNHCTGFLSEDVNSLKMVDFESQAIEFRPQLNKSCRFLGHPTRGDLLTVRELARIQGFPDDFIFYDRDSSQFSAVIQALPPPIAKMLAESVLTIVRTFENQQPFNERSRGGRKRPRI